MKILVTGGAGYIGSACVEALIERGDQVAVLDNLSEGHRSAVHPAAQLTIGCLTQAQETETLIRRFAPEAVIHFAASALVNESMRQPGKYFTNNITGGINLLNACQKNKTPKIVISSTCAIYGHPKTTPIPEETPPNPINPYGESKTTLEKILHWFHQIHGLPYIAFRYFNACGATPNYGEHHRTETHLIPNALKTALKKQTTCPIYGTDYPTPDGTCIRDYIHIQDLAQAHITATQTNHTGCYNLGTGKGHSVLEIINTCQTITGKPIQTTQKPRRPGDPPQLIANPNKAKTQLQWTPRHTNIQTIIQTAWHWHQQHPNGYPD